MPQQSATEASMELSSSPAMRRETGSTPSCRVGKKGGASLSGTAWGFCTGVWQRGQLPAPAPSSTPQLTQ